jgi:hypothetical protein
MDAELLGAALAAKGPLTAREILGRMILWARSVGQLKYFMQIMTSQPR